MVPPHLLWNLIVFSVFTGLKRHIGQNFSFAIMLFSNKEFLISMTSEIILGITK